MRFFFMINLYSACMVAAIFSSPLISAEHGEVKKVGGIELVYLKPGSFVMGAEAKGKDFHPPRRVSLKKGFWIGRYEVNQKLYREIAGLSPCENSKYGAGDSMPVYNVSWYDAVEFCNMLSEKSGLKPYYVIDKNSSDDDNISDGDEIKWTVETSDDADGFRLPTEAQWEYSCRGGSPDKFYWGDSQSWDVSGKYAWHMFNAGQKRYKDGRFWWVKYHKVKNCGSRKPNKWGLFDMSGNVAEWCFDRYNAAYYSDNVKTDPAGPGGEYQFRVLRGGSMLDAPADLSSYKRWAAGPYEKRGINGIRVVLPE